MVTYQPADVIPMSEFEFAWRITDAKWSSLPPDTLRRIRPLSESKSQQLLKVSPYTGLTAPLFDANRYHVTREVSLEDNSDLDRVRVQESLRQLPLVSDQEVYLSWHAAEGVAAITDWRTFTELWDDLWYPFDRLCIFDDTRRWAVFVGPEERALFVEANPG